MKFFMLSKCGEGAQILYRIALEGNDVRLCIQEKEYWRNWDGLIPKEDISSEFIDKNTIILLDFSGMGEIADNLRKEGYKVFGGSKFADKLEEDRAFGLEFMERCGISHPQTKEFDVKDLRAAKKYITSRSETRLVFKPSGEALPCHLTYCGEDGEDLIRFIDYAYQYYGKEIESFVLQDFVEGDLISSELFFDGKKACYPANHTIEVKKFMTGDKGPSTGCSGNLVWAEYEDCDIVCQGIGLVEDLLLKEGYCGQLDLNAIVNSEGVFGLEWTPRFGYDSIPSLIPLIEGELGKFFSDLASGTGRMKLKCDYSAGVRFTIPPYPIEPNKLRNVLKESPNLGVPIRGFSPDDIRNLYFYEVMLDDDDNLVHGDGTGLIGVAGGVSDEPKEAFAEAYGLLELASIPDLQYRDDLEEVIPEMYNEVEKWEIVNARH